MLEITSEIHFLSAPTINSIYDAGRRQRTLIIYVSKELLASSLHGELNGQKPKHTHTSTYVYINSMEEVRCLPAMLARSKHTLWEGCVYWIKGYGLWTTIHTQFPLIIGTCWLDDDDDDITNCRLNYLPILRPRNSVHIIRYHLCPGIECVCVCVDESVWIGRVW